ncbi:MAG TPA: ATP-binding cassette domain-containing protein [Pseudonocardiaceae bacterium]
MTAAITRGWRTPLPWLGGLLLLYLLIPLVAFVVRLPTIPRAEMAAPGVMDALVVSLVTATISAAIVTVLGVPLGYVLAQSHGRIASVLGALLQIPLALPPLISGLLLIYLVGPYSPIGELSGQNLTDNLIGIVIAQTFVAAPFLIVSARSAFDAVDPALAEVAATLGHGPWSRALRVALPCAMSGIRAGMLLAWLRAFGEFGATVVLAYHPYSLPVFVYVQFSGSGLNSTTIPVGVTMLAALVILLLAEVRFPWPVRRRRQTVLPAPRRPESSTSPRLDFQLRARLGGFRVDVGHAGRGRHLAILGSSGSGKTATLRLLAGLLRPESGQILLDEVDISRTPVEQRGIGYLPQDSTLLPRMSVWRQINFGVGADPAVGAYWLAKLQLEELADRRPNQLSGGQKRRVALARALVRQPRLVLLDEPFTGLDAPVRDELRRVLRRLQRDTAMTTVLVTHDPEEAALLADEIIVLVDGRVVQAGRTQEVFSHPATPMAARLLGVRNLGEGVIEAGGLLRAGAMRIETATPDRVGHRVSWCVRPEDVRLLPAGTDHMGHPGTVIDVVQLGPVAELEVSLAGGGELTASVPAAGAPALGTACRVLVPPTAITVWDDHS